MKRRTIALILISALLFSAIIIVLICNRSGIKKVAGIEMSLIPGGTFIMGKSASDKTTIPGELPAHSVTLDSFYISRYEITIEQYDSVIDYNPSDFKGQENLPVQMMSWYDAVEFCNAISRKAGLAEYYAIDRTKRDARNLNTTDETAWTVTFNKNADGFRLPTEAQWEYACRAGSGTVYFWGDTINDKYVWYFNKSQILSARSVMPVGKKKPNAFGLFDMSGNVWEWCQDWYDENYYAKSPAANPAGPDKGSHRVLRGGSIYSVEEHQRSSMRYAYPAGLRAHTHGIRAVLPAYK